jgi:hypothetical protein
MCMVYDLSDVGSCQLWRSLPQVAKSALPLRQGLRSHRLPTDFGPTCPARCSTRQEELEIALQVAHEVNAHLNKEVMQLTQQVEALQQERDACLAHIKLLAQKVAEERSKSAVRPTAAPGHAAPYPWTTASVSPCVHGHSFHQLQWLERRASKTGLTVALEL